MTKPVDVLVIGAGMAGCAAALAAAQCGARVQVIDGGGGATHLSGGTWDIASDLREPVARALEPGRSLAKRIREFVSAHPNHPYARLPGDAVDLVRRAHELVLPALGGYRPLDLESVGVLILTDLGMVRRAATAQHQILILDPHLARIAVADMYGYRTTDASFLSASLRALFPHAESSVVPIEVDAAPTATARDHAEQLAEYDGHVLAEAWRASNADAMACPPVLGIDRDALVSELAAARAGSIGEISSPMNGVQGIRLQRMVERAFERAECQIQRGRVRTIDPRPEGTVVELSTGQRFTAGATVLCTGKYVGGGLGVHGAVVREAVASLPMFSSCRPQALVTSAQGADPAMLFGMELATGGPGFRQGVGYDESLRALSHDGAPIADDLFVAGDVLDGVDPARDGTGFGCAVLTGFIAGQHAAGRG